MFVCVVFIWEQTATCATYSINWLVFITEMKSVYCAVRTGSLNKAVCCSSLRVKLQAGVAPDQFWKLRRKERPLDLAGDVTYFWYLRQFTSHIRTLKLYHATCCKSSRCLPDGSLLSLWKFNLCKLLAGLCFSEFARWIKSVPWLSLMYIYFLFVLLLQHFFDLYH